MLALKLLLAVAGVLMIATAAEARSDAAPKRR